MRIYLVLFFVFVCGTYAEEQSRASGPGSGPYDNEHVLFPSNENTTTTEEPSTTKNHNDAMVKNVGLPLESLRCLNIGSSAGGTGDETLIDFGDGNVQPSTEIPHTINCTLLVTTTEIPNNNTEIQTNGTDTNTTGEPNTVTRNGTAEGTGSSAQGTNKPPEVQPHQQQVRTTVLHTNPPTTIDVIVGTTLKVNGSRLGTGSGPNSHGTGTLKKRAGEVPGTSAGSGHNNCDFFCPPEGNQPSTVAPGGNGNLSSNTSAGTGSSTHGGNGTESGTGSSIHSGSTAVPNGVTIFDGHTVSSGAGSTGGTNKTEAGTSGGSGSKSSGSPNSALSTSMPVHGGTTANPAINGGTTANSVVHGVTTSHSVIHGGTSVNPAVHGVTTAHLAVNGGTTAHSAVHGGSTVNPSVSHHPVTTDNNQLPNINVDDKLNHTGECRDLINCRVYPKDKICPSDSVYRPWAEVRCSVYCGFCDPHTSPIPCVDKIPNCNEYDADLCTNPLYRLFKEDNCRKFCGLCT